jgi:hypothetical protein
MASDLATLKSAVREVGRRYPDRYDRARRLYVQDRAAALADDRDVEYKIKSEVHKYFDIPYSDVLFAGSAQLGFSAVKDTLFTPARSDLDIACVNTTLFQKAWVDVIEESRAFTNGAAFGSSKASEIELFKESIVKRGMIKISGMPNSQMAIRWRQFESTLTRRYSANFGGVTVAIYMNEYAFCWKQDSALKIVCG